MKFVVLALLVGGCAAEKGEPIPPVSDEPTLGIGVRMVEGNDQGQWVIDTVLPNSPAERAGVTVGDRVLAFNDVPLPARMGQDCISEWFDLHLWGVEVASARADGWERLTLIRDGLVFTESVPVEPLDELIGMSNGVESGCKMCWSGCPEDYSGYVICKPGNVCSGRCRTG